MMFLDGLQPYEVALLGLGVFFFLVLVAAFVFLLVKGRPLGTLLMFFAVPVVMIGFPGIKSIQFKDGVISIDRSTDELQKNPTDTALRDTLKTQLAAVKDRPSTNPETIAVIAKAQFALGNHEAAAAGLNRVVQLGGALPGQAVALQKRLELDEKVTRLAAQAEKQPANASVKASLEQTVSEASHLQIASPTLLANVARANALLGNRTEAVNLAQKALTIDPNQSIAKQVVAPEALAAPR